MNTTLLTSSSGTAGTFQTGRILAEHRDRYWVLLNETELEAEITGNLRYTAASREDLPVVGDWVTLMVHDTEFALIHAVLPRRGLIKRLSAGRSGEFQPIAANVDLAFLVQAADRDFNLNRLERYLTLTFSAGAKPVVVITKTDLADVEVLNGIQTAVNRRIPDVPLVLISNQTGEGFGELEKHLIAGQTVCLLGSSGVGKSSLVNRLTGETTMETSGISQTTGKGRHTTTRRELIRLTGGAFLIDNPGMREVGIGDAGDGLDLVFSLIESLAAGCRFADCSHQHETGCAVREAVATGQLDEKSYANFLKMEKERRFFESTAQDRKRKEKLMGRLVKDFKKNDYKGRR